MRVMQTRETIREPRPEVQQGAGGPAGHPRIAVGRACRHALEQSEHAPHPVNSVERGDKMHLRGAGIGEAGVNAGREERPDERLRARHAPAGASGLR